MTNGKMPESGGSGRSDPVTGDAPHYQTIPAMPMTMMPTTASSAALDNSRHLPLSPPSTPSTSPQDESALHSWASRDEARLHNETRLREALASIARQEKAEMPDTPESTPLTMSPADIVVRHQPSASARDFVCSVLPAIGRRYLVEDAGMELVCPGWTGAVLIDTRPLYTSPSSFSTRASTSQSSFSSGRMSRTSSASSSLPLPVPRRTLLTRIAAAPHDTKDLRSSILDALDHATEKLLVENVVFVLDRSGLNDDMFRVMVHGLCYVGASIVGHGSHAEDGASRNRGGRSNDAEEDLLAPRNVSPGLVLLSVDV